MNSEDPRIASDSPSGRSGGPGVAALVLLAIPGLFLASILLLVVGSILAGVGVAFISVFGALLTAAFAIVVTLIKVLLWPLLIVLAIIGLVWLISRGRERRPV